MDIQSTCGAWTILFLCRKLHAGDEVVFACVPSSLSGIESAVADHGIKLFHLSDSVGSIPLQDSETAQCMNNFKNLALIQILVILYSLHSLMLIGKAVEWSMLASPIVRNHQTASALVIIIVGV